MKLKSQNKYKRLNKPFIFILSIILTLSIYSLEGFKKPYRADTYYKGYTTQYGSYSLVETNLFGNTRVQSLFMYAFNGVYNGRIRIYYTAASYNGNDSILPINCTIESRSDSYLQVTFKNVSEICIIFQNAVLNPIDITSVQYPGDNPMTKITNGTNNQLETIETILYNIQTTNQTIATNTNGIATTNTQLTTLNSNVNGILTQISNYFTDNNGVTINIGDIILQFNEFNAQLQLQLGILNDLKTALLDIDNKIDTITWLNKSSFVYSISTTSYNEGFNDMTANSTYGNTVYIRIPRANINDNNKIYHFRIPLYTSITNENQLTFTLYNEWGSEAQSIKYIQVRNNRYIDIFINIPYVHNLQYIFKFVSSNTIRSSSMSETEQYYEYIENTDIEYYNLIQYFKNYEYQKAVIDKLNSITIYNYNSKLDDILMAINNINMSVTNTTVNDTQVNIENYNDIMTDIENIEVNFNTQFNTNNNGISDSTFRQKSYTNEKNLLNNIGQNLIMLNPRLSSMVYVILLGVIVIAILG